MTVKNETIMQITVPTPFAVGDVHLYLIKGETLSLIDAGVKTKEAWEVLTEQLRSFGYYPKDIEQIILTHHHPDHIGLVDQFPRVKDIFGHKNNDHWLQREEAYFIKYEQFFANLYESCGVPATYQTFLKTLRSPLRYAGKGELSGYLEEGDYLPGHEEWHVLETPGHAQSHLSFYKDSDGSLLAGDHLLHHISSNPLLEPPEGDQLHRPRPLLQYRTAMIKCLDYDISTVFPGHGPIFSEVKPLIQKRLEKQEQRAIKVLEFIKEASLTPFEICMLLFPKHIDKEFGLTMSETIGQLDFLEDRDLVRTTEKDGVWRYAAKA